MTKSVVKPSVKLVGCMGACSFLTALKEAGLYEPRLVGELAFILYMSGVGKWWPGVNLSSSSLYPHCTMYTTRV